MVLRNSGERPLQGGRKVLPTLSSLSFDEHSSTWSVWYPGKAVRFHGKKNFPRTFSFFKNDERWAQLSGVFAGWEILSFLWELAMCHFSASLRPLWAVALLKQPSITLCGRWKWQAPLALAILFIFGEILAKGVSRHVGLRFQWEGCGQIGWIPLCLLPPSARWIRVCIVMRFSQVMVTVLKFEKCW